MSLETYLKRVLNESNKSEDDDGYAAVVEIYEDGDECCDDEWTEAYAKLEAVKRAFVVRNGNITSIARSSKPGYKIAHGEERKMNFAERRARTRAAERTYIARKKWQSDKLQQQRHDSIGKRKDFGLDQE